MLKFYCNLTGQNYSVVKSYQPSSKRKVSLYANCLLIPTILWFINGFLLVNKVLEGSLSSAFVTAFVASFLIFLIERSILLTSGGKAILRFRLTLGIFVSILGSICLDEVVFKHDIDNQVSLIKQTEIENSNDKVDLDFQNRISEQKNIVRKKGEMWSQSLDDAKGEADGTKGSHQKLFGKIALLKLNVAAQQEIDYKNENNKLTELQKNLETEKQKSKIKAEKNFNESALLIRIRALFELIFHDPFMLAVYLIFTAFLFSLEFLVVIIKRYSPNSIDEDIEKKKDDLIKKKQETLIQLLNGIHDPNLSISSINAANELLKSNQIVNLN